VLFFRKKDQEEPDFELRKPSTGQDYISVEQPHTNKRKRKWQRYKDARRQITKLAYNKLDKRST